MGDKYQSGKVIPPKEEIGSKCKICYHRNIVPSEIAFARVSYPNGYNEPAHYDYTTNAVSANVARVKKYFCTDCRREIPGPKRLEE